jgi:hypothetical protein
MAKWKELQELHYLNKEMLKRLFPSGVTQKFSETFDQCTYRIRLISGFISSLHVLAASCIGFHRGLFSHMGNLTNS